MKRIVIVAFLLFMSFLPVTAQLLRAGLSAGIDASRVAITGASGTPLFYTNNIAGGVFAEAVITPVISLQLELNHSTQGVGSIGQSANAIVYNSVRIDYYTIPLFLKLYGTPNLSFFAGTQLGIKRKALAKTTGNLNIDFDGMIRANDLYGLFGMEYRFANGVFAGGRYHTGLTNILKTTDNEIHNRYFSFRLGYSFLLNKK